MDIPIVGKYLNTDLLRHPLSWAILFLFATIWLLGFHVVMRGFTAMQSGGPQVAFAGPGQIAIAPDVTANFATAGSLGSGTDLSPFYGTGLSSWTDGYESKYAEDGWAANG